jgi:hypothetical protein
MPQLHGTRYEGIQRNQRLASSTRDVILDSCRIKLGPPRRDPRGTTQPSEQYERVPINTVRCSRPQNEEAALQGASATGGSAVTRRARPARVTAERQPPGVMPRRSTTFEFGVRALARRAHVNRAYAESPCGDEAHAHNQRREDHTRRCTLQNGLPAKSSAAHGVHG